MLIRVATAYVWIIPVQLMDKFAMLLCKACSLIPIRFHFFEECLELGLNRLIKRFFYYSHDSIDFVLKINRWRICSITTWRSTEKIKNTMREITKKPPQYWFLKQSIVMYSKDRININLWTGMKLCVVVRGFA